MVNHVCTGRPCKLHTKRSEPSQELSNPEHSCCEATVLTIISSWTNLQAVPSQGYIKPNFELTSDPYLTLLVSHTSWSTCSRRSKTRCGPSGQIIVHPWSTDMIRRLVKLWMDTEFRCTCMCVCVSVPGFCLIKGCFSSSPLSNAYSVWGFALGPVSFCLSSVFECFVYTP